MANRSRGGSSKPAVSQSKSQEKIVRVISIENLQKQLLKKQRLEEEKR